MVIVESHHFVLKAWAQYRAQLPRAPRLLTLDHHTDTSAPFRKYFLNHPNIKSQEITRDWLSAIDFKNPSTIETAISYLSHDEHIVTAIKTDIISSAFVIAQNAYDTDLAIYKEHKIMCLGLDRKVNSQGVLDRDCDLALESHFLESMLESFNKKLKESQEPKLAEIPYILDIDLDYLNTLQSVMPKDSKTLKKLAQNAGLITIATEPAHVQMCAREANVTSSFLLHQLQMLIQS